jgi:hypothetical protein
MSKSKKSKKRRNKTYSGQNAAKQQPTIHRYSAVERSKLGQWWHDNKRIAAPVLKYGSGAILIILTILGLISVF